MHILVFYHSFPARFPKKGERPGNDGNADAPVWMKKKEQLSLC
jgi:hypothetical protein